jgi:hypothetical protein
MPRGIRFTLSLAILLAPLGWGELSAQGLFHAPDYYSTGLDPRDVAAADLDGDAWLDLAVANRGSGSVSVFLNQGDGSFQAAVPFAAGAEPLALAIGDLDGDSHPEIVTSNSGSNSVSVLKGNGDGSFQAAVSFTVGDEPWGLALADYDGDEQLDVAVVNRTSLSVSILLNDGAGGLLPAGSFYAAGFSTKPSWLTAGDLDGDGDPDLVVAKNYQNLYFTEGYVEIFMNDGAGGFSSAGSITIGNTGSNPQLLDLDEDEDLDIAIAGFVGSSNKLNLLLNDGDGNFGEPLISYSAGTGRACAGDFDADGDSDLAISRRDYGSSSLAILLCDGSADFAPPFTVSVGADPKGLVSGDFNRDGDEDIAVAVSGLNRMAVLESSADPVTAVDEAGEDLPGTIPFLAHNHPNPFNPSTTIEYWLPDAASVRLSIFSADGRRIRTLVDGEWRAAGAQRLRWDGTDGSGRQVGSGVYLSRLEVGGRRESRRMLLLK